MPHSKRIIYYAERKKVDAQPSCDMYKITCLLDRGVEPWYIEDNDLQAALHDNGIFVNGSAIDINGADYSVIECDTVRTNLLDFYSYDEVIHPTEMIVWRTFCFFYDTDLKHPLFCKYSNIEALEPFFSKIVAVP
jgi:hypothetical protein